MEKPYTIMRGGKMKTDKMIINEIKQKIAAGNLCDAYNSIYPRVFRYSDSRSVKKDALMDLKISYATNCIARSSSKIKIGDGVLVVARKEFSKKITCFAGVSINFLGETSLWKSKGGAKWKYGYNIIKLSEMICLDQYLIEAITGQEKINWKIFNGLSLTNSFLLTKNGQAIKKIFDHCVTHCPISNPNKTIFKDLDDLDKIKIY